MKLIEAVNICTRAAGHGSVNTLTAGDAKAAEAQSVIERVRKDVLGRGWPFNTNEVDLAVDGNGRIPISNEYLKIQLESQYDVRWLDGSRYIWDLATSDYHDTAMTNVRVVFDITEIRQIRNDFGLWIAWEAAMEYFAISHSPSDPPKWLVVRRNDAHANAVNSTRQRTLDDATGWSQLETYAGSTGVAVRVGSRWVTLG